MARRKGPITKTTSVEGSSADTSWRWNSDLFHTKYQIDAESGCWVWHGANTKHGPLFGAAVGDKNNQMTQAARISYMEHTGKPLELLAVYHDCGNRNCVNPLHLKVGPSVRHGLSGTAHE